MDELVLETESLAERQAVFQLWTEMVRDPAQRQSEGVRELIVLNRAATASYEIAPLPNERWAVTVRYEYHCGHCHGAGVPWTEFPSRDECIEFFLNTARHHFGQSIGCDGSDHQRKAQVEMNRLLKGGLFGFIEPTPSRGYEGL
ncbi:MAG: hypothetical protein NTZ32_24520 [Planctomycetales bacterium]|nr:hypothetical protein [Planctomycetales bacterium]